MYTHHTAPWSSSFNSRDTLKEIVIVMLELVDIWKLKYPDLVRYTWQRLNFGIGVHAVGWLS